MADLPGGVQVVQGADQLLGNDLQFFLRNGLLLENFIQTGVREVLSD